MCASPAYVVTATGSACFSLAPTISSQSIAPNSANRPSTGCISMDTSIRPSKCPRPTRSCPRTASCTGPHSDTSWVNMIGVPAVVVPPGFYASGLPFGLEISMRRWHDCDLLGWAYSFEQSTHLRKPPVLVEKGLLPNN